MKDLIILYSDANGKIYEVIPSEITFDAQTNFQFGGPYEVFSGPAEVEDKLTFFNPYYLGQLQTLPSTWVYLGGLYHDFR